MELIENIFNFIGSIFKFILNIIKGILKIYDESVRYIAGIFGIESFLGEITIAFFVAIIASIIPDLISYYGCRFSKKYRSLKTKEEKKEYLSERTHFLLKAILTFNNFIAKKKSRHVIYKNKKTSKNKEVTSDDIIDSIKPNNQINYDLKVQPEKKESYNQVKQKNYEMKKLNKIVEANILTEETQKTNNSLRKEVISNEKVSDKSKRNIKVIYSSNMIGNMLRKDVVLERKFLNSDKPVLIDFTNKPKEVFTGHLCDSESGIKFKKMINGKKIEIALDNPDFMSDTRLYDELNSEELKQLKEQLIRDYNYQGSLHNFFIINDKALKFKKI